MAICFQGKYNSNCRNLFSSEAQLLCVPGVGATWCNTYPEKLGVLEVQGWCNHSIPTLPHYCIALNAKSLLPDPFSDLRSTSFVSLPWVAKTWLSARAWASQARSRLKIAKQRLSRYGVTPPEDDTQCSQNLHCDSTGSAHSECAWGEVLLCTCFHAHRFKFTVPLKCPWSSTLSSSLGTMSTI